MGKVLLSAIIVIACVLQMNAQDFIYLTNGDEVKAKVEEITETQIKYKQWDNQTGPLRSFSISNVFMIIYENGQKEVFTSVKDETSKDQQEETESHRWVDLGLESGTLWATCNLGAGTSTEYGDYYAWGEIKPKTIYKKDNYTYRSQNPDILPDDVDVATVLWGEEWSIPTKEQWKELKYDCEWRWESDGYLIIGPSGKSIFLPAAGLYEGNKLHQIGTFGYYWAKTIYSNITSYAWCVKIGSKINTLDGFNRVLGRTIRPVCSKKNK